MLGQGSNSPVIRMSCEDRVSIFFSFSHKFHALAHKSFSGGVPLKTMSGSFLRKSARRQSAIRPAIH
jgi:hypothetical protein